MTVLQTSPASFAASSGSHGNDTEKGEIVNQSSSDGEPHVQAFKSVDWNGPDDTELPLNWKSSKKWKNILMIAILTLLTPFASSMFAPAIDQVMRDMGTTNRDIGSFCVSIYLLGYAFGPLILAPCSELFGRLPIYHVCTFLFILTNVACALSVNMPMLIIFRFLTGLVGACPLTVGPGSVSDCFRQEERRRAMAVWTMPVLLGPCIGPAVGAYVSRSLGWRWDFWLLIIATGVDFLINLVFLDETHPMTLLKTKARKLRKSTGDNGIRSRTELDKTPVAYFKMSILRPVKMLALSPIIFGLSLLTAVAYGTLYLLFTTITDVFTTRYGIETNIGLVYLGFGVGQFIGLFIFGISSDMVVKNMAKNGEMKPEYRLPIMIPGAAMVPIGLLIFGWTAQYGVYWLVPIIGTALIGFGMITIFTPVGTYLVDAFPVYAASASAANIVFRSIGGALLPLAGPRLFETLDQGWGNTLLAGISLLMMGMIYIALRFGEVLRTHPKYQLKL